MAAPVVQNLNDLIAKYTTAQAPQVQQLDTEANNAEQSGSAQISGLDQAKTNAFGDITQAASDKNMLFSGFAPDQQARYVGATYLPALAKVQAAIATARGAVSKGKADLITGANNSAIGEQNNEQQQLDAYNAEQEKEAQAVAEAQRQRDFEASQNSLNRSASAAGNSTSPTDARAAIIGQTNSYLGGLVGSDNRVSPTTYAQAKSIWTANGYAPSEFDNVFAAYRNPNNKYYKLG